LKRFDGSFPEIGESAEDSSPPRIGRIPGAKKKRETTGAAQGAVQLWWLWSHFPAEF